MSYSKDSNVDYKVEKTISGGWVQLAAWQKALYGLLTMIILVSLAIIAIQMNRVAALQANKQVVRRFLDEVWTQGDLAITDDLFDTDFVLHGYPSEIPPNREGIKRIVSMYRNAFPDLQITIEDQIAEGDKVMTRFTLSGTHEGELMGIAPTGKQVIVTWIVIDRFTDDKIAENWTSLDELEILRQLGVSPALGEGSK